MKRLQSLIPASHLIISTAVFPPATPRGKLVSFRWPFHSQTKRALPAVTLLDHGSH